MWLGSARMELEEMTAMLREQDTLLGGRKRQHFEVRHRGVGIPRIERCQDVVAKAAQFDNN
jgi:hypothetical protein